MLFRSPGSSITYQTSGGGFANVGLVSTGKADLAIVHDAELRLAVNGEEPFRAPSRNLRAIACMYNFAPAQFVIAAEQGTLTRAQFEANAQSFVDSRIWLQLQGSWQRTVRGWAEEGLVII